MIITNKVLEMNYNLVTTTTELKKGDFLTFSQGSHRGTVSSAFVYKSEGTRFKSQSFHWLYWCIGHTLVYIKV